MFAYLSGVEVGIYGDSLSSLLPFLESVSYLSLGRAPQVCRRHIWRGLNSQILIRLMWRA
jgi:hypothetical protein